jgi:hypothetical protein
MEPNTTNETAPGVGRLCVFGAEAAGVVSSAGAASEADPLTACRTATASRITLRQNRSRGQSHHHQHGHITSTFFNFWPTFSNPLRYPNG